MRHRAKGRILASSGPGLNRIFQLSTGEIWQQVGFGPYIGYINGKDVEISESDGKYYMKIEGQPEPVEVRRPYGLPASWRRPTMPGSGAIPMPPHTPSNDEDKK